MAGAIVTFFSAKAVPDPGIRCSALWRGYVSVYRLNGAGRLMLECFEYPFHKGRPDDPVGEELVGDFWPVLKESFFANRTYIPFSDGTVIKDRSCWVQEVRPNHTFTPRLRRSSP